MQIFCTLAVYFRIQNRGVVNKIFVNVKLPALLIQLTKKLVDTKISV